MVQPNSVAFQGPQSEPKTLVSEGHKMALGASNGAVGAKPMRYFKRRHLWQKAEIWLISCVV